MTNILFVTQKIGKDANDKAHCGVGIRGLLTSNILKRSTKYHFIQCFTDGPDVVEEYITQYSPKVILYNFHGNTTPWIYEGKIQQKYPHIIQVLIVYDLSQQQVDEIPSDGYAGVRYLICDDDTLRGNGQVFIVPRSLPCDGLYINKKDTATTTASTASTAVGGKHIPKIGYQGFGMEHKGIRDLARVVQEEFDEAIVRLHIPYSYYGDPNGDLARQRAIEVLEVLHKPNIKLEISHNFMSDEEIVSWLHENDINCYFYWPQYGCGVASSPDYAISAGKPIAITHSDQLRNMWNLNPPILIENTPLKTIMSYGTKPLEPLYVRNSNTNMIREYELVLGKLCSS
jgi:hypothetical protein